MRLPRRRVVALAAAAAALAATPSALAVKGKPHTKRLVNLDLLAINDFHGQLEKVPATSSSGRINTTPAGGAEYLATHLDRLRAEARARGASTLTVGAGDLIGATPLLSAAFHDEPTIEAMNLMKLDVASVGNHEFDEGYRELQRMQYGGCLPDGEGADNQNSCPDPAAPFAGADFRYLAANTFYSGSRRTVLPPYTVKSVRGVKVGFIGVTLEDTPNIVTKAGIQGLTFTDEVETINALVPELRRRKVQAIVVLMHEGGVPADATQYDGCAGVTGPGIEIAKQVSPAVDVVITGHTHQAYNCVVSDPAGNPRRVTSASSAGRLVTSIQLQLDPRTKDVVRPSVLARNVIVTNADVTPRADITALIEKYRVLVAPIANRVLGRVAPVDAVNSVSRANDADGESPLGNLIAVGNGSGLEASSALLEAARQGAVTLVNNAVTHTIASDPSLLAMFFDEEIDSHLLPAERKFIKENLAWTSILHDHSVLRNGKQIELAPFVKRNRSKFVLKPVLRRPSPETLIGGEVDKKTWESAIDQALSSENRLMTATPPTIRMVCARFRRRWSAARRAVPA